MLGRYAANSVIVLAAVIFALLLGEVGLRFTGKLLPNRFFRMSDASTAWKDKPGAEGWSKEGDNFFRLNGEGLHDREHSKEKPAGTLRIAVLGDSFAEGIQVPTEKTFSAVLERELTGCSPIGNRRVEVINFGVGGYGTAQELLTLRNRVWDYSPDIVLLAFLTLNDITDNSYELSRLGRPYFVRHGGHLVLDESHHVYPWFRSRFLTETYYWVKYHSRMLELVSEVKGRANWLRPSNPGTESGLDNMIFREPSEAAWQEAWLVTEDLIVTMRNEVLARGSKFVVVTLSDGIQVNPDPNVRAEYMKRLRLENLFYPDLRIRALGEREGIPVLNLAPAFQKYAEEHKIFLHGFRVNNLLGYGHWNENGHRLAGEMIARKLCAEALSP